MDWRVLWIVCSLQFGSLAWASYVEDAHKIVVDTHQDYLSFEKGEGDKEKLLAGAKSRLEEIKKLDGDFVTYVQEILESLHSLSPSYRWLRTLRLDVDNTIAAVSNTLVRKESKVDLDPERVGGINLEAIDPQTHDLINAHISHANYVPVVKLLQACAFNVRLQESYLKNSDMGAVLDGKQPHLHWFDFIKVHEHMVYAINVLRRFFPLFPDPSFGVLMAKDGGDKGFDGLSAYWTHKVQATLTAPTQKIPEPVAENIKVSVHIIAHGVSMVERYRQRFFPKFNNDAEGIFFSNALFSVRGAHACLALSKGYSDYVGAPCDFAGFKKALVSYIKYYDQLADHGVLALALQQVLDYMDEADGARGLPRLKKRLTDIAVKSNVNPKIAEVWPKLIDALFDENLDPKKGKNLRGLLLDENTSPLAIYGLLKKAFLSVGVGVCRDGEKQLRECGGFEDFQPSMIVAQDLLKGFEVHVEKVLKDSPLAGGMDEKLGSLSKKITFLDASRSSCGPYVKPTAEDKQNASWVQYSEGFASHDAGREASANGYHKMIWVHRTSVTNAVSIQEEVEWPKKQLAGLSVVAAVQTIIPNVVHTQMLINDGKLKSSEITALGIHLPKNPAVEYVSARYAYPEFNSVSAQAKAAYVDMLHRYAWKYKLLQFEKGKELTQELIDAEFEKRYDEIAVHYRKRHQAEMYVAAKAIQKFDKMLDDFRQPTYYVPKDAPAAIYALTGDPKSSAFTGGVKEDQKQNSSIAYLVDMIKYEYLIHKLKDREAAQAAMKKTVLSTEDFLESFKLYGTKYVGAHLMQEWYWKKENRVILTKLYEHGLNIWYKRREYLEYAKDVLFYQFPALKWKDAWKEYDGTETSYRNVLRAFQANAIDQANRYAKLGADKDEEGAVKVILEEVVPNLPLMDMVLRTFPQFKKALCLEQIARNLSEERFDTVLYSVEGAAAVLCFVPVLAPVAGVVTVATIGVGLVAHGVRAYTKYKEIENARFFETAVGPQVDPEQLENNMLYYREMNDAYGQALGLFVIDAVTATAVAIKPIRAAVGEGLTQVGKGARAYGPPVWNYAKAFPGRMATVWRSASREALKEGFREGLRTAMNPFVRWGIAQRWTTRTLASRLSVLFRVNSSWLPLGRRVGAIFRHTGKGLLEIVAHHPWSLFGHQWARTPLSVGLQITWFAGEGVGLYFILDEYFKDREIARTTNAMLEKPEAYGDWINLVRSGRISKSELYLLIEMDRSLGEAKRKEFQAVADEIEAAYLDSKDKEAIKNLNDNLNTVGISIKARVDQAKKESGENSPEYQMWLRVQKQFEQQRNRLAAFK